MILRCSFPCFCSIATQKQNARCSVIVFTNQKQKQIDHHTKLTSIITMAPSRRSHAKKKKRTSVYERLKDRENDIQRQKEKWQNRKDKNKKKSVVFDDDKQKYDRDDDETVTDDEMTNASEKNQDAVKEKGIGDDNLPDNDDDVGNNLRHDALALLNFSNQNSKQSAASKSSPDRSKQIAEDLFKVDTDSSDEDSDDGFAEDFAKALDDEDKLQAVRISYIVKELSANAVKYLAVYDHDDNDLKEKPVGVLDWALLMSRNERVRTGTIDTIKSSAFTNFFFECCQTLSGQFYFVLINSPSLTKEMNKPGKIASFESFKDHINGSTDEHFAVFPNFSEDAILIVPKCTDNENAQDFFDLATFVRKAKPEKIDILFKTMAEEFLKSTEARTYCFLSTCGLSEPWLHFRLDNSPKYYHKHYHSDMPKTALAVDDQANKEKETTKKDETLYTSRTPAKPAAAGMVCASWHFMKDKNYCVFPDGKIRETRHLCAGNCGKYLHGGACCCNGKEMEGMMCFSCTPPLERVGRSATAAPDQGSKVGKTASTTRMLCASYDSSLDFNPCSMAFDLDPDLATVTKHSPRCATCHLFIHGVDCSFNKDELMCYKCSLSQKRSTTSTAAGSHSTATHANMSSSKTSSSTSMMSTAASMTQNKQELHGGDDDDDDDRSSKDDSTDRSSSKSVNGKEVSASIPRIDKWWTDPNDAILHGLFEGTRKIFKSQSPIATVARNDSVVTCDDGNQYYLLRHKSHAQTKAKTKRRELDGPALSVAQAKDDRTSQQVRMMVQRAEIAMRMQSYDASIDSENMPSITTYIITKDKIIEKPHLPKNGMVTRDPPMWTVMAPIGHAKNDVIDNLEKLLSTLKDSNKKKKKSSSSSPKEVSVVSTAEKYLDNLYGAGEGKKLLAPVIPPKKKRKKN
jgi:hypothetical protein